MTQQPLLIDVPESLSPRLAWLREHGISTKHRPELSPEEPPWEAWIGEDYGEIVNRVFGAALDKDGNSIDPEQSTEFVIGDSEMDVLLELAARNHLDPWSGE